jgi:hypothetical protein
MSFLFEESLQSAIAASPNVLSTSSLPGGRLLMGREVGVDHDIRRSSGPESDRVAQQEVRLGRGRMDVVFVEIDATPTIVEAKLHANATMKDVLDQAARYAEAMFANPKVATEEIFRSLSRMSRRFPDSPNVPKAVKLALTGWDPDRLRAEVEQKLRARECRIVIAADAIPPQVVRDAAALRPRIKGCRLDLFNVSLDGACAVSATEIEEDADTYERDFVRPAPLPM